MFPPFQSFVNFLLSFPFSPLLFFSLHLPCSLPLFLLFSPPVLPFIPSPPFLPFLLSPPAYPFRYLLFPSLFPSLCIYFTHSLVSFSHPSHLFSHYFPPSSIYFLQSAYPSSSFRPHSLLAFHSFLNLLIVQYNFRFSFPPSLPPLLSTLSHLLLELPPLPILTTIP